MGYFVVVVKFEGQNRKGTNDQEIMKDIIVIDWGRLFCAFSYPWPCISSIPPHTPLSFLWAASPKDHGPSTGCYIISSTSILGIRCFGNNFAFDFLNAIWLRLRLDWSISWEGASSLGLRFTSWGVRCVCRCWLFTSFGGWSFHLIWRLRRFFAWGSFWGSGSPLKGREGEYPLNFLSFLSEKGLN